LAGAKLLTLYPVSIPAHGMALNMTVQSYHGALDFGLTACRRTVPELRKLADYLEESLDELHEAVLGVSIAPKPVAISYAGGTQARRTRLPLLRRRLVRAFASRARRRASRCPRRRLCVRAVPPSQRVRDARLTSHPNPFCPQPEETTMVTRKTTSAKTTAAKKAAAPMKAAARRPPPPPRTANRRAPRSRAAVDGRSRQAGREVQAARHRRQCDRRAQRKDMEALAEPTARRYEGIKALAQRRNEILQERCASGRRR
jgi:hypothetical protein